MLTANLKAGGYNVAQTTTGFSTSRAPLLGSITVLTLPVLVGVNITFLVVLPKYIERLLERSASRIPQFGANGGPVVINYC